MSAELVYAENCGPIQRCTRACACISTRTWELCIVIVFFDHRRLLKCQRMLCVVAAALEATCRSAAMPQDSDNPRPRLRSCNKVEADLITCKPGAECDEAGNRECLQPSQASAVLLARCQLLRILPSAVESWAEMYSEPIHGMICYMCAVSGMPGCVLYRFFYAARSTTYDYMFTYAYAGILTYPLVMSLPPYLVV